ncbi:tyramine beta-hydroxylase-like [Mizuhopecten yessoensis]|uniref:Temptin n=1 Tax=Mizuhopecten yessoensis TaxID=6573 RepID=A0A210QV66_MIZYE|nr:tyramine beta-hydroxylase-like [Mizuhopecten yessoensis]OWF52617.1 Temptin [Mizuhopecten yessoensis]
MRGLIAVLCLSTVWGYRHFQDEIPNGGNVPHPCMANYIWKGVGHLNPLGGGDRNPFGLEFKNAGMTWTKALCEMDSDGDGITNGEELGDPDCVWTKGNTPTATTGISHPGVCTPYSDPLCQASNSWIDCNAGFQCDALSDVGTKSITVRFPEMAVPPTSTSSYCMLLDLPTDGDYHLVANTPYINNEEVTHQILLYACDEKAATPIMDFSVNTTQSCSSAIHQTCTVLIGKWSDGLNGECLHKDFGFRIGQNGFKKALMQIHRHNHKLRSDFTDSSGMTLYYTANRRLNDANIMTIGQQYLAIPPGEAAYQVEGSCSADCSSRKISSTVYITRAYNHMHYLGRKQRIEQYRNGVKLRVIADDNVFSSDSSVTHDFHDPIELRPGDELKTTCTFNSIGKTETTFQGNGNSDEACLSFLAFYPAENMKMPSCVQWKGIDMCKWTDYREEFSVIDGCNVRSFQNTTHPDFQDLYHNVMDTCRPFMSCLKECKEYTEKVLSKNACLIGDVGDMFRKLTKSSPDVEYTKFWGSIDSCKPRKSCLCETESETKNIPNQCLNSTGGAGSVRASTFAFILSLLVYLLTV